MKIVLIGWNENAQFSLIELINSNNKPLCIFTPTGYSTDSLKDIANQHKILLKETGPKLKELLEFIKDKKFDILISASCPFILTDEVINQFTYGAINIHSALLPQLRGIHPINWSLLRDLLYTGVTIHYVNQDIDAGPIIIQKKIKIGNHDTASSLRLKTTKLGSKLLIKALQRIAEGRPATTQNHSLATFAPRRNPTDGLINWSKNTREIFNLVRSLSQPDYPSSFTYSNKEIIKVIKSYVGKNPGKVLASYKSYYLIETGDGVILIQTDKKLKIGEILNNDQK